MGIQNFQILQPLGKGAFASVFKVTRLADGKTYALKRVNIENMSQKELDDTLNEIRFLASFKHPRLVRWYETFLEKDDTELCIIMEFCGCGDLAQKIERYKKRRQYIDERVIWVYMIQMLEGLKALHEKNIMHRDLKAANCFLAEDGSIKIGDMNVSKVMREGLLKTQIGTPYYMSPEIWSNRPYNASSDIWSLGCLMYELCALRPPFLGDREALMLPEIVARKCLVKNAMTEADEAGSPELMPTIRVSKMSALAQKLPKPAYADEQPHPDVPDTPMMMLQVSTVPTEAPSHPHEQEAANRKASVVPVSASDISYQRRGSTYNPEEYDKRISLVAEAAQERLRGLLGGDQSRRQSGNAGVSGGSTATGGMLMDDGGERLVSGAAVQQQGGPQPRRGSVLISMGLGFNLGGAGGSSNNNLNNHQGAAVAPKSPMGLPSPLSPGRGRSNSSAMQPAIALERQGSIKKTLSAANDEAASAGEDNTVHKPAFSQAFSQC